MELKKITEAYTLTDNPENGWNVLGQVTIEESEIFTIQFSVNDSEHIGNYTYSINPQIQDVNINYNCKKNYENEFFAYCDQLVDQVLTQLGKK